ncbi:MAG TPA: PEP-CTERM sorting domain-containing protein [Gemmatimonadaceae bacterium]|jgi:hypothetical protein|nr:PEP-CTERM sorting domain-containing protein [Gemmatimonadaceae bacterium]
MTHTRRLASLTLGLILATAARADAQVNVGVGCSPGIPSCGSLRFFIQAVGGVSIDQLFITLLSPPAAFVPGSGSTGTYSAEDSFGPYGGFTTIGGSGASLAIDFLENGFPFETLGSDIGTLDLGAQGVGSVSGLYYTVSGVTDDGGTFTVSATPEPATLALVATGLGVIVGMRRRRKRLGV